jgi:hypothetical protein
MHLWRISQHHTLSSINIIDRHSGNPSIMPCHSLQCARDVNDVPRDPLQMDRCIPYSGIIQNSEGDGKASFELSSARWLALKMHITLIDKFPAESRFSVVRLCHLLPSGSTGSYS